MDKTLTQAGDGSAIQSGAIYKAAARNLINENFSEIAGTNTLEEPGAQHASVSDETNPANGEIVDPSTKTDPNIEIA